MVSHYRLHSLIQLLVTRLWARRSVIMNGLHEWKRFAPAARFRFRSDSTIRPMFQIFILTNGDVLQHNPKGKAVLPLVKIKIGNLARTVLYVIRHIMSEALFTIAVTRTLFSSLPIVCVTPRVSIHDGHLNYQSRDFSLRSFRSECRYTVLIITGPKLMDSRRQYVVEE